MRASSLSNAKVIELLNSCFVPVYLNNRDYDEKTGRASPEEKAEKARIFREAFAGTVCSYILGPDGKAIDSSVVSKSYKPDVLLPLLEKTIAKLKVDKGETLVKPLLRSRCPQAAEDALVLHLVARYLVKKGSSLVPLSATHLGTNKAGNWNDTPSENWIVLAKPEWTKLLPATPDVEVGTTWDLDRETASRFLLYCYPPTEENDVSRNRIGEQILKARVLSNANGIVKLRLDGSLKMNHPFYPRSVKSKLESKQVQARLVGVVEFDADRKRIRTFQMVTDGATYDGPFGVAIRSVGPQGK